MQKYIDLPFKIAKKNLKCFAVVSESDMYWGNKQTNKPWSNTQKHNVKCGSTAIHEKQTK